MNDKEINDKINLCENRLCKMCRMTAVNRARHVEQLLALRCELKETIGHSGDTNVLLIDGIKFAKTLGDLCCRVISNDDFDYYLSLMVDDYNALKEYDSDNKLAKCHKQTLCKINGYLHVSDISNAETRTQKVYSIIQNINSSIGFDREK